MQAGNEARPILREAEPFPGTVPVSEERLILLAEDDTELRSLLAETLREDGYRVLEARDGVELIDRLEEAVAMRVRHGTQLALVVTDVRMPGLSGLDILGLLGCTRWQVPVLVVTAFGDAETHTEAQRLHARAVLDKPFEIDAFRKEVERCAV